MTRTRAEIAAGDVAATVACFRALGQLVSSMPTGDTQDAARGLA